MEKMDWKKLGLYALAGFGAFALYKKYTTPEEAEVIVLEEEEEEPTASFTGTRWQGKGRDTTTNWQRGNVFANASGRRRLREGPSGYVRPAGDLTPEEAAKVAAAPWLTHTGGGGKYGRYIPMSGTEWQMRGQALNSGTKWQDDNMNACGACAG